MKASLSMDVRPQPPAPPKKHHHGTASGVIPWTAASCYLATKIHQVPSSNKLGPFELQKTIYSL